MIQEETEQKEEISNKVLFMIISILFILFISLGLYNYYKSYGYIIYKIENDKKIEVRSTDLRIISWGKQNKYEFVATEQHLGWEKTFGNCEEQNETLWKCGEYYIQFESPPS